MSDNVTCVYSNSGSWNVAWYHVAVTSDGTTLKMYINGVQQTVTANVGNLKFFVNTGNLTISTGRDSFPGKIDEVRIYRQALTQSEIQKLYVEGLERHRDLVIK